MIIKNPLVNGVVKEVHPDIFAVIIEDDYERGMLFCRYQEFYESPIKLIRGKSFSLSMFMDVYRKTYGKKIFSYPYDWVGYNIPSNVLYKAYDKLNTKQYISEYDEIMGKIMLWCQNKKKGDNFYLIGVNKKNIQLVNHEIAHGLYYTNKEYKKIVDMLILDIPKKEYNFVKNKLVKMGYLNQKKIINDEIQAYFSTGLDSSFETLPIISISKKFKENFKRYVSKR